MSNPSFISSLLSTAKKASHGCPGHWSHLIEEFNWINCWVKIHHKAVRYKENRWVDFWHLYFYHKDTEPLYHSFMYSFVSLLSGIYPLPVMHSLLATLYLLCLIWGEKLAIFFIFSYPLYAKKLNKCKRAYFDQQVQCAAPIPWLKYTTYILALFQNDSSFLRKMEIKNTEIVFVRNKIATLSNMSATLTDWNKIYDF